MNPKAAPVLLENQPLIFLLSLTLFSVTNILLVKSGRLLRSISLIRTDLFGGEDKHVDALRHSEIWIVVFAYGMMLAVWLGNQFYIAYFLSYSNEYALLDIWYSVLERPDKLAPIILTLAVAPAAVAMFNFALFASLSSKLGKSVPQSPSPTIGLFGAFLAMLSLLGSLASIWSLLYIYFPKQLGSS